MPSAVPLKRRCSWPLSSAWHPRLGLDRKMESVAAVLSATFALRWGDGEPWLGTQRRRVSFDVTFPGGRFGVIEGQVTGRRPGSPCHLGVSSEASRGGDVHLWETVDSGTHHLHG